MKKCVISQKRDLPRFWSGNRTNFEHFWSDRILEELGFAYMDSVDHPIMFLKLTEPKKPIRKKSHSV